jgi:hypothetical protein
LAEHIWTRVQHFATNKKKPLILHLIFGGDSVESKIDAARAEQHHLEVKTTGQMRTTNIWRFDHIFSHREVLLGLPFKSFLSLRLLMLFYTLSKTLRHFKNIIVKLNFEKPY